MRWLASFLCVFVFAAPSAAQKDSDLPAAPSAVKTEQQKPPQPPPPAPAESKPAEKPAKKPAAENPAPASGFASSGSAPASSTTPASQPGGAELPGPETIITIRVDEIAVVFTVTDKRGRFVKDLKQEDFRILDDKRPVKAVRAFRAETDLPLRVGLLIDASTSVRDRFKFEQEAAVEFLSQIVRYKKDAAFVLGFDSVYEVVQDFSDDNEKLSKGIRKLRPGGGTAMYDALFFSCRDKLMTRSDLFAVRRAVILLSDGEDTQSRVTLGEAVGICQRAEVVVYTISTNITGPKPYDKDLKRIAEETGGRAFFPFKLDDVANAFLDIQEELRSQYAVAYAPEAFAADGRFRSIEIKPRTGKLEVRARRGYYAPTK
ncbi:MAG: VWA domain-containing protein [Terriglobales bacterium]